MITYNVYVYVLELNKRDMTVKRRKIFFADPYVWTHVGRTTPKSVFLSTITVKHWLPCLFELVIIYTAVSETFSSLMSVGMNRIAPPLNNHN